MPSTASDFFFNLKICYIVIYCVLRWLPSTHLRPGSALVWSNISLEASWYIKFTIFLFTSIIWPEGKSRRCTAEFADSPESDRGRDVNASAVAPCYPLDLRFRTCAAALRQTEDRMQKPSWQFSRVLPEATDMSLPNVKIDISEYSSSLSLPGHLWKSPQCGWMYV